MPFVEGVPTVTVQLDKPREIAYTLGAMRRVRDELVKRQIALDEADPVENMLAIPIHVWASMDAEGRAELTVAQVEDLIHPGNLRAISDAIRKLESMSLPDRTETEEGEDQTPDPTARPKLAG